MCGAIEVMATCGICMLPSILKCKERIFGPSQCERLIYVGRIPALDGKLECVRPELHWKSQDAMKGLRAFEQHSWENMDKDYHIRVRKVPAGSLENWQRHRDETWDNYTPAPLTASQRVPPRKNVSSSTSEGQEPTGPRPARITVQKQGAQRFSSKPPFGATEVNPDAQLSQEPGSHADNVQDDFDHEKTPRPEQAESSQSSNLATPSSSEPQPTTQRQADIEEVEDLIRRLETTTMFKQLRAAGQI